MTTTPGKDNCIMSTVFDQPATLALNRVRQDAIRQLVRELSDRQPAENSPVDLVCGVGIFSKLLAALGLEVVGVNGRAEDLEEAQRGYPTVQFVR